MSNFKTGFYVLFAVVLIWLLWLVSYSTGIMVFKAMTAMVGMFVVVAFLIGTGIGYFIGRTIGGK